MNLSPKGGSGKILPYRLDVVPTEAPPLRERVADIPLLVEYFIDRFGKRAGKNSAIDKQSLKVFQAYEWPGNVRELPKCDRACGYPQRG